tara:strand:+ start:706 stop:1050 length:345 start_codon:yes stop_codon:yes gene_type:complete
VSSNIDNAYVIFRGNTGRWYSRFLHNDFGHCLVVEPSQGKFVVYEKTTEKVLVYNVSHINDIIGPTDITVSYIKKDGKKKLFMLNTCVGHTKQFLGINHSFIWTPYQLYKYMQR